MRIPLTLRTLPAVAAALAALLTVSVPANAVVIPEVCAACRHVLHHDPFMRCLDECLNGGRGYENGYNNGAAALREARWAGWNFAKNNAYASKSSQTPYVDPFDRETYATITLSPHHGAPGLRLQIGSLSFPIMDASVTFRVDDRNALTIKADKWSDSRTFWTSDKNLLAQLRTGRTLKATVTPFGEGPINFTFDLSGTRDAMDVIWP